MIEAFHPFCYSARHAAGCWYLTGTRWHFSLRDCALRYLSLEAEQWAREDAAVRAALVRVAAHVPEVVEG